MRINNRHVILAVSSALTLTLVTVPVMAQDAGDIATAYGMWGEGATSNKDPLAGNEALTRSMWERITAAAEQYNKAGNFTALIRFEWGSVCG